MNEIAKMTTYEAFAMNITSEFLLPELKQIYLEKSEPDLVIKKEDLSNLWSEVVQTDTFYYVKENLCMVRIADVAIFKIENGKEVSVSPMEDSNDDQVRLYILGTCLGVALMQRRVLPLHGSCIAVDGKAYAFVGDSGAGKSTLASAFIERGFQLLTDDVIAVSLSKNNAPIVTPSYPQQKLWQESLDLFGRDSNQYKPVYDRVTKFAVPVNDQFIEKSMPLAGVFELTKTDQNDIEIIPIQQLERFPVLFYNTYRNFMINRSGLMEWHFDFSASLVNNLDFHRIIRPNSRFTANELVDSILNVINKDEKTYQKGEKVI